MYWAVEYDRYVSVFKFSAATLINLGEIPQMSPDFFE